MKNLTPQLFDVSLKQQGERAADIESTFVNLKQNKGFRRFMLRGRGKVSVEVGLLAIANNWSFIAPYLQDFFESP